MKKEGPNRRKEQAAETKNKITKSAEQLFGKYGLDEVSVDAIVESAGVSKGTFYVHFDSKDALIASLINNYVNSVDMDYKSYIESIPENTPVSDILVSLTGKIADVITCTIGYEKMAAIYKAQLMKNVNTEAIMGYNRDLYKMFSDVIGQGIRQGEFKIALPVDTLAKHFVMALRGMTYEWCIRYPDFDLIEQALKHLQILITGLKGNQ